MSLLFDLARRPTPTAAVARPSRTGGLVRRHPFLLIFLAGCGLLGVWLVLGMVTGAWQELRLLYLAWRVLCAPLYLAANLLAPYTDRWPDTLDAGAAIAAGVAPYLLADWALRRWRSRRPWPKGGAGELPHRRP